MNTEEEPLVPKFIVGPSLRASLAMLFRSRIVGAGLLLYWCLAAIPLFYVKKDQFEYLTQTFDLWLVVGAPSAIVILASYLCQRDLKSDEAGASETPNPTAYVFTKALASWIFGLVLVAPGILIWFSKTPSWDVRGFFFEPLLRLLSFGLAAPFVGIIGTYRSPFTYNRWPGVVTFAGYCGPLVWFLTSRLYQARISMSGFVQLWTLFELPLMVGLFSWAVAACDGRAKAAWAVSRIAFLTSMGVFGYALSQLAPNISGYLSVTSESGKLFCLALPWALLASVGLDPGLDFRTDRSLFRPSKMLTTDPSGVGPYLTALLLCIRDLWAVGERELKVLICLFALQAILCGRIGRLAGGGVSEDWWGSGFIVIFLLSSVSGSLVFVPVTPHSPPTMFYISMFGWTGIMTVLVVLLENFRPNPKPAEG